MILHINHYNNDPKESPRKNICETPVLCHTCVMCISAAIHPHGTRRVYFNKSSSSETRTHLNRNKIVVGLRIGVTAFIFRYCWLFVQHERFFGIDVDVVHHIDCHTTVLSSFLIQFIHFVRFVEPLNGVRIDV